MMKKIYLLTLTGLMVTVGVTAQSLRKESGTIGPVNVSSSRVKVITTGENRAVGDTLMYAPFFDIYVNATDQATFALSNDDQDGLVANNGGNWTGSFAFWYTLPPDNTADLTAFDLTAPWADSANFAGATSWFLPAGQADNWLSMGPITVPALGAKLSWRVKTNPAYRDGYRVLVNGTGLDPVADFGSEVIYSRADSYPNATDAIDTVWTYYSVNIPPSYNSSQVYFGFNHTANDMDVLWLDEILMVEFPTMGVDDHEFDGFGLTNVMPNPASDVAYINYQLGKTADVTFVVTDINGKVVSTLYQGSKEMGAYTYPLTVNELNSGIYFVTLKAGNFSSTKKLIVSK